MTGPIPPLLLWRVITLFLAGLVTVTAATARFIEWLGGEEGLDEGPTTALPPGEGREW